MKNGGGDMHGGAIIETEEDDFDEGGDIGEDEKKHRKAMQLAAADSEGKKKVGNNQDLIRETGLGSLTGGPPSGYTSYLGGLSGGAGFSQPPSKIQMLMGFNHLNTIEEEKHET